MTSTPACQHDSMRGTMTRARGVASSVHRRTRPLTRRIRYGDRNGQHWVRVAMDRDIEEHLRSLGPNRLDAVEISGNGRGTLPWREYVPVAYPDFDLLNPRPVGEFDVVICEQVLEHVADPVTAVTTLRSLCRPGGLVVASTPFMLKIHGAPEDHWRFTPTGLQQLLECGGLRVDRIGFWGNHSCIRANRKEWAAYRWWHRVVPTWALRNDPSLPQVVWAFARRPLDERPL